MISGLDIELLEIGILDANLPEKTKENRVVPTKIRGNFKGESI